MKTKYEAICERLGYRPEVRFVTMTTRGTIGFSCGKPDEIRTLYRRVLEVGLRPSRAFIAAYNRIA